MSDTEENLTLVRSLLYENYNKVNFEAYTSCIENLIILENFLRKSDTIISHAVEKAQNKKDSAGALFLDKTIENLKR